MPIGGAVQVSKPLTGWNGFGCGGGWTIWTGQWAGTPRQLVYTGVGVVCAGAVSAGVGEAGARWGISGADWTAAPAISGAGVSSAGPAGARCRVLSTRSTTAGSVP